ANPAHVGLLFLKADTFQRKVVWDVPDNLERDAIIKRHRHGFEAAVDRFRNAASMGGCDNAIARAVLLSNFGRDNQALDRVNDALSCRPTVPYLHTLKAWFSLQVPADEGILTAEEVNRILSNLQPAFDTPPDDHNAYLIRALVYAAAGRWED